MDMEIQKRALAYLDRNGTRLPLPELREKLSAAFEALESLLATTGQEEARQKPAPEKWCVQEVVDHLIESHRPAIPQVRGALAGADPGAVIPAHLQSAQPLAASFREKVAELEAVHRGLDALFDGAPEDPAAARRIPIAMVLKDAEGRLVEWTEELDYKAYLQGLRVHTLEHLAQIERTLAAVRAA